MDRKEDRKSLHEKDKETEGSGPSGDSDAETSHSLDEGKHSEPGSGDEVDCNQNQGARQRPKTEDDAKNSETNVGNTPSFNLIPEHNESVRHSKERPNDHLRTTDEEKNLKLSEISDLEDKRSKDNREKSNAYDGTAIPDTATGHQEISPKPRSGVKCTRSRENCECFKSNNEQVTRTLYADKTDKTSKVKDEDDVETICDQGTLGPDIQQTRKSVNGYTTIYNRRNGQGSTNERLLYTRTNGNGNMSNGGERETAVRREHKHQRHEHLRRGSENATSEPRMEFFKAELNIDNENDCGYSSFKSNHEWSSSHRDVSSETCFDSGIDTDSQGSETNPKEINRVENGVHEHSQRYEQSNQNSNLKRISEETECKQEVGKNMTHSINISSNNKSNTKLQRSHERSNALDENSTKEAVLSNEDVNETVDETKPKTINVNIDVQIQQKELNGFQQNVPPGDKLPDKDSTEKKEIWPGNIPHQRATQEKESYEIWDTDNTTPKESLLSSTSHVDKECLRNCSNTYETVSQCSEERVVDTALSSDPNENTLLQKLECESNESEWVVVNESDVNKTDSIHSEDNEGVEQNDENDFVESEGQDVVSEFKENQHP